LRPFARRLAGINAFQVVEVLTRARELEAAGRSIIHLEVGEPDFTTADPIIRAGQASLGRGETHYTQATGTPALRTALADYYRRTYGVTVAPERILITPGASGALLLAAMLLINPGEGLLMTDPGYPCNRHFLRLADGDGQLVPVGPDEHYQLTAALAERYWQPNTAGVLVASPANPTGEMLSRAQLADLARCCERRSGYLVVDEIYHGLTYDGDAPSVLEVSQDAFVINSFSKYFGMTGWRLGWMVAPEAAVPDLERLAQNLFISMSTTAQHAALAAFEPQTQAILRQRRDELAKRRNYLLPELRRLGFEIAHTPPGALYLYANIRRFSTDSQAFCLNLLEEHGVAITPGTDFGDHLAHEHVRFAYTTDLPHLEEAVRRLERALG
jgi:aspartate/methionine/tyrosine aminotransferase